MGQELNLKESSDLTCDVRTLIFSSQTSSQHSWLVYVWNGCEGADSQPQLFENVNALNAGTASWSSLSSFHPRCGKHHACSTVGQ